MAKTYYEDLFGYFGTFFGLEFYWSCKINNKERHDKLFNLINCSRVLLQWEKNDSSQTVNYLPVIIIVMGTKICLIDVIKQRTQLR